MKIPKLLVLGVLASSLCMVGSAFGQVGLDDSMDPFAQTYQVGDTIEFELCLAVSVGDVNLVDLDVYFFPPGSPPSDDACDDPATEGVFIAHIDLLEAGDSVCFDSNDNAALAYLVTGADCNETTTIVADMAVTFHAQGVPALELCDEKTTINFVEPVDAPVCDVNGPTVVCEGAEEVEYSTSAIADTYSWSVTGDAVTVGPTNGTSVLVSPTSAAGFTVELEVCNDNGDGGCCSDCNLPVTVTEAPDCLINGPDSICDSATEVQFCSDVNDAGSYYWEIVSGTAVIVGDNNEPCVLVDPNGPNDFTLKLSICNTDPLCCDSCEKRVDVVPTPDCLIEGPSTVCEDSNNVYCSNAEADIYLWEVTGDAVIVGPNDTNCVTVHAGATGVFTLTLELCNELGIVIAQPDQLAGCCNTCELEVTVEECGGTFCSFTQGFWGNAGGKKCGGQTTSELIQAALDANDGSITVGIPPRSITFNSVACILASLPAGGTPSALPATGGPWTCANLSSFYKNKNKTEINNVLVGQAVALTLNLLVSEGCVEESGILADWVLPAEFCTVPYGDEEACAEYSSIPTSMVGKTVAEMLAAVNAALAGTGSISDAYGAATAINEGFDECRTLVPCIRPEICDNGCDDDGDGLVDLDDPDCQD